jgi:phage gpG-like protein
MAFESGVSIDAENFRRYIEAVKKRLINPRFEVSQTKDIILADIKDHFDKEMSPVGKWTRRKDPRGKWPVLNKTGTLKSGIDAEVAIRSDGIKIKMFIDNEAIIYGAVHNNGLRIPNRGGGLTKMPKRQFAWISRQAKDKITDVWTKGL